MIVRNDDRAVSELLGAILLFGLVLLLLVVAQYTLVPLLNQQAEIEHESRVNDDLASVQESLFRIAATGAPEQTSLEAGMTHPKYPFLVNPPPVRGVVETLPEGVVVISNVTSANAETADYWGRGPSSVGEYTTRNLQYAADYQEYGNAGTTVLEGSVLYTDFDGTRVVTGTQAPLVNGRRITIVTVSGDLRESSVASLPVALSAPSGPARTISVTNAVDAGTGIDYPIDLVFDTGLTAAEWTEILDSEIDGSGDVTNGRYVHAIEQVGDRVRIVFEAGVTYDLRMAGIGVGENLPRENPAYVTRDPGTFSVVPNSGGEVLVTVRDRYNNPVSGAEVTFNITNQEGRLNASFVDPVGGNLDNIVTVRSDENGLASVILAGNDVDVEIEAFADFDGNPAIAAFEDVRFDVQVGAGTVVPQDDDDDDGRELNPNAPEEVVYIDAVTRGGSSCSPRCEVSVRFWNRVGSDVDVTEVRINSYSPNGPGNSEDNYPDRAVVSGADRTPIGVAIVGGEVLDIDPDLTIPTGAGDPGPGSQVGNASTAFEMVFAFEEFRESNNGPGAFEQYYVSPGAIFLLTVTFEDGEKTTYVVTPRGE